MSKSSITIRPATPADLPEIQRLNTALFRFEDSLDLHDHSRNLSWPSSEAGLAYFSKCCEPAPGSAAFIAQLENRQVIGYLAASLYDRTWMSVNPIAEINNMFVEEAHRHRGAGGHLVDAFKEWARTHHAQRLKVGALTGNHPAVAFYERHGFRNTEIFFEQPAQSTHEA